jgi:hypothetical protein
MTRLEALKELAEKVEAGAEYLDRDIQDVWGGYRNSTQSQDAAKAYHGSLDSALALHEAVLPGWEYGVTRNPEQPRGPCAYVAPWGACDDSPLGKEALSVTPARAWLLAILKVLISEAENDAS